MTYTIDIRQRRQATIPNAVLVQLGVSVGDSLEIEVSGKKAVVTPKKQIALNALVEIQKAFRQSKISMSTFTNEIDKQRLIKAKSFTNN